MFVRYAQHFRRTFHLFFRHGVRVIKGKLCTHLNVYIFISYRCLNCKQKNRVNFIAVKLRVVN